mgnify:CR=1 FL=1
MPDFCCVTWEVSRKAAVYQAPALRLYLQLQLVSCDIIHRSKASLELDTPNNPRTAKITPITDNGSTNIFDASSSAPCIPALVSTMTHRDDAPNSRQKARGGSKRRRNEQCLSFRRPSPLSVLRHRSHCCDHP